MAYRSGTYVAFHAEGNTNPTETDMKYYRMLQAWHDHQNIEFSLVNSHESTDTSVVSIEVRGWAVRGWAALALTRSAISRSWSAVIAPRW